MAAMSELNGKLAKYISEKPETSYILDQLRWWLDTNPMTSALSPDGFYVTSLESLDKRVTQIPDRIFVAIQQISTAANDAPK